MNREYNKSHYILSLLYISSVYLKASSKLNCRFLSKLTFYSAFAGVDGSIFNPEVEDSGRTLDGSNASSHVLRA